MTKERMRRWRWCEREDAALDQLHDARAEKLYLRGLRKYMDYETGVVGIQRGVSHQMFIELLEERRERGSTAGGYRPDRYQIIRLLDKLEKVGLITRIPGEKRNSPMVFRLDLADTALIRPNEERTMSALPAPHLANLDEVGLSVTMNAQRAHYEERTTSGISGFISNSKELDCASAEAPVVHRATFKIPDCPHQQIIDLYHKRLPELRRIKAWGDKRKTTLRSAWRQSRQHQSLAFWEGYFGKVKQSDFLMGRISGSDGRTFDCDLEWLVKYSNLVKVVEGKYDNKGRLV